VALEKGKRSGRFLRTPLVGAAYTNRLLRAISLVRSREVRPSELLFPLHMFDATLVRGIACPLDWSICRGCHACSRKILILTNFGLRTCWSPGFLGRASPKSPPQRL
jgi:hypothetical protein